MHQIKFMVLYMTQVSMKYLKELQALLNRSGPPWRGGRVETFDLFRLLVTHIRKVLLDQLNGPFVQLDKIV